MLVSHSDDIAVNRFSACTSIEEEMNSPEERAPISKFTISILHAIYDPFADAQLLFLLVECTILPHQQ